ncbi:MAG TPA: MBL fold metallo-hydrolase [Oligoflexia bacterium]|nr:MBL fold metallo-hydrolase [Oligoflexia bacterium]HMP26638.1 MBL fold metallo-hydrolase [Oligoflexia bacterium]
MGKFNFIQLGSGSSFGVPVPACQCAVCLSENPKNKRFRTSALISNESGENLLIDCSADFRTLALKHKIKNINGLLLTHCHADHVLGLDDLRGYNKAQKSPIKIFSSEVTFKEISRIFSYAFQQNPSLAGLSAPQFEIHQLEPFAEFEILGIKAKTFELIHGKMSVIGLRIGELVYATDFKNCSQETLNIIKGCKYLMLDSIGYQQISQHLTIPEAIEFSKKVGAEKTYLIHLNHKVDHDQTNAQLPAGIELAYDGLSFSFLA